MRALGSVPCPEGVSRCYTGTKHSI